MRALLFLVLTSAACATTGPDDNEATSALGAGAIAVQGGDVWFRKIGCPSPDPSTCLYEANFWVDLEVRNDAYHKRVGIVWIDRVRDDASAPWHVTDARYEGTRADGYETWGIDVAVRVIGGNEPNPRIQLAAFVEMNGETLWENNGGADHVLE